MLKTVVFPPMSSLCSSFVGYWLFWVMEFSSAERAFSHHQHPGDSCLSGSEAVLKGIGWRLGNVKSREEAAAVFVWNVFLFAPGLQKRAATCPGTLWRGCLEKNEQFAVHFCSTNCMLQILDETSLLDTFTKLVCREICAHFCETRYSNRVAPFHGLRLQVKTTQGWSQDERNQGCIPYHSQISRSAVWHTTPYMLCYITHCVQNYTGVCVHCQKFLPYGNFYTNAVLVALATNAALRSNPVWIS